jgi:dolichol-phosphate mannosyltransferase
VPCPPVAELPLSVVIPVYNEAGNIGPTLDALERHIQIPHEVIVVYDLDEDTTLPEVRARLAAAPHLRLVKNTVVRGPSGALRQGFREALGERVLVVMADQCDDFTQIPELLDLVPARADIACPSRYCPGGEQQLKTTTLKVWAPRTAGYLLHLLTGLDTYDPTNSFKMYSGRMLRDISLTSRVSFSVTLEIVAKAHGLRYRITEIPTVWRDRSVGATNFKIGRSLIAYLPWFFLTILGSRFLPMRAPWRRRLFAAGLGGAAQSTGS